ncbi:hypothetical protein [Cognataquiflexum rubidum]|uniref:hypothetical protein n=1 Tax=Cognataquiflexum rubidum TaxID=2922273 RepID=UPI001F134E50|nr:hypothetical protein [Cognataquiflexum rubidum]MCH6236404.1 hypothetical protein [Cognataquiflexum rubidum]
MVGRKRVWAIAQSPILTTTFTLSCLRRKGYELMLSYHLKTHPIADLQSSENTRPVSRSCGSGVRFVRRGVGALPH